MSAWKQTSDTRNTYGNKTYKHVCLAGFLIIEKSVEKCKG